MKISRRKFLMSTTALGMVGVNAQCALAKDAVSPSAHQTSVSETTDYLVRYVQKANFVAAQAAPIISGHRFNGGLNYDEHIAKSSQSIYLIQPSSRVEDIAKKSKNGSLPLFTILGFNSSLQVNLTDHSQFIFDFLIGDVGLDPKRIHITSTELIKPLLPSMLRYGISENKIQLRPLSEAKKAGDGSGWFAPEGHPKQVMMPSFSVEYLMPDGLDLEIAEFGINDLSGGFGIERLTMAKNQNYFSWNDYLPEFKRVVEEEAQKNRQALPVGYYEILGLPKPAST